MGYREVAADSGYAEWDDGPEEEDEPERFAEPANCGKCGRMYTLLLEEGRDRNGLICCWKCADDDLRRWEAERAKGHMDGSSSPPY